jgi:hypothetical protein
MNCYLLEVEEVFLCHLPTSYIQTIDLEFLSNNYEIVKIFVYFMTRIGLATESSDKEQSNATLRMQFLLFVQRFCVLAYAYTRYAYDMRMRNVTRIWAASPMAPTWPLL